LLFLRWSPNCFWAEMVRVVSVLGLVMFSVALLILSLISYVSIKKDFIFSAPKYTNAGGPRMYMFHTGFRSQLAMKFLDPAFTSLNNALNENLQESSSWRFNKSTYLLQRSTKGPRAEFAAFVEWTLVRNGSPFPTCSQGLSASATPGPEPSPPSPRCVERMPEPTADGEPEPAMTDQPSPHRATELRIATEPVAMKSVQVCEPATPPAMREKDTDRDLRILPVTLALRLSIAALGSSSTCSAAVGLPLELVAIPPPWLLPPSPPPWAIVMAVPWVLLGSCCFSKEIAQYIDVPHNFTLTKSSVRVGQLMHYDYSSHKYVFSIGENLKSLLPDSSPVLNKRFNTCAVVGNSGILTGSRCGAQIDSYDFVFRCNFAPTEVFRRDVGRRTNLTTFNPSILEKYYNNLLTIQDRNNFYLSLKKLDGAILWIPAFFFHTSATVTRTLVDFFVEHKGQLKVQLAWPGNIMQYVNRYWGNEAALPKVHEHRDPDVSRLGPRLCVNSALYDSALRLGNPKRQKELALPFTTTRKHQVPPPSGRSLNQLPRVHGSSRCMQTASSKLALTTAPVGQRSGA
ncbi:hypothetical protein cypCar_00026301, partial [Cyprinus carpio]